jgi:hypothetical protein
VKIKNYQVLNSYRGTLSNLKKLAKQEKINYPAKVSSLAEFEEIQISKTKDKKSKILIDNLLNHLTKDEESKLVDKIEYKKFEDQYNNYRLKRPFPKKSESPSKQTKQNGNEETLHFLRIKMVTETFADLLAVQGFYKEAFNIYNSLITNENPNKKRLLEKLTELERNFI